MTRRPDKKVAEFHRRNLALLGLAKVDYTRFPTAELKALGTPEALKELERRELNNLAPWRLK